MALIDELKEMRAEAAVAREMQESCVIAHQANVDEWVAKLADLDIAIAALEPHTSGPSPETIRTFDLMSEDEYCEAFRDRIIADEAEQQASVDMAAAVERAKQAGAKAREAGEDSTACPYPQDSLEATAWTGGWIEPQASEGENVVTVTLPQGSMTEEQVVAAIQEAGGYAPVTEPEPERKAGVLEDAELDAEYEEMKRRETADRKLHFSIFGKLENA